MTNFQQRSYRLDICYVYTLVECIIVMLLNTQNGDIHNIENNQIWWSYALIKKVHLLIYDTICGYVTWN